MTKFAMKRDDGKTATGAIIYYGPSMIDGSPIVAIATFKSGNVKTADMLQTHILHATIDPISANRKGDDKAICGDCKHRGIASDKISGQAEKRTCYVTLMHGPSGVYKSFQRGIYPDVSNEPQTIAAIGENRMVRIGTYGDGAAVPGHVWRNLLNRSKGHTGYTHAWHGADNNSASDLAQTYMFSADTLAEAESAWTMGARTFRVVSSVDEIVKGKEILCPASAEAGHRTTCDKCGLCAGLASMAKSIAIPVHGGGSKHFAR